MLIKFFCPNGHKLKADHGLVGKKGVCPKCEAKVQIPAPLEKRISDTSIAAALGDFIPTRTDPPQERDESAKTRRSCPKCRRVIIGAYRVCPSCNIYLPT